MSSKTSAPDEDIQLGTPRTLTAVSHVRLPEGFRTDLPDPIHAKTEFATFDKTYRYENNEVVVERTIVILKRKVAKADWKKYQEFTKNISLDNEAWIQLFRPSKPLTVRTDGAKSKDSDTKTSAKTTQGEPAKSGGNASPPEASVKELLNEAVEKVRTGDWDRARELLNQMKQKDPKAHGLWAELGFIAQNSDHNLDEAKADYRKELAIESDNEWTVNALSQLELRTGDSTAARQTVHNYLDSHPENVRMALYLSSLQSAANDIEGALKTLEDAAAHNPDNHVLPVQMGGVLVRLHRNQEAAAAARTAMEGSDDPELLNDAAYVLSESGVGLSLAEEASRKSIAKLEEESAGITTAEANSKAFARANLLIAAWDTLGWTLFREDKAAEAEPIISAAWRASLRAEIGDHLAQIYEANGQKQRAYDQYLLVQAGIAKYTSPEIKTHVVEKIAELRPAGTKPSRGPDSEALQSLRTYKIKKPAGASGWGTFRLVISVEGVIQSQQMSGDPKLDALKPSINAMKFPEMLPPASKARLLRSAVVSCSMGTNCDIVLVPDGGLQTEQE